MVSSVWMQKWHLFSMCRGSRCALQCGSHLLCRISSALQLLVSPALQSHEHNSEARDLCGKTCLLCGVVLAFKESLLEVNSVSSLIRDEGFEV